MELFARLDRSLRRAERAKMPLCDKESLHTQLLQEENRLRNAYYRLGRAYMEQKEYGKCVNTEDLLTQIEQSEQNIAAYRKQLDK